MCVCVCVCVCVRVRVRVRVCVCVCACIALCKERKLAQVLSGKRKVRSSPDVEEETSDVEDDDMLGGRHTMSEDSDRDVEVNVDEE